MTLGVRKGICTRFHRVVARLEDPQTDGDLLARFLAERDDVAFAALVRRHGPLVLGICRRVTANPDLADDAFQAVFLVLARKADTIHPREAVRGWLYGVATRTALKARRMADRRRKRETLVPVIPDRVQPTIESVDPDTLRMLDEEIARLPDHLRAAVVLCELDGVGRKDAAARLGIPEGTLSSRLAKARRLLASRLRDRGAAALPLAFVIAGEGSAVPSALLESTVHNVGVVLGCAAGKVPATVQSLSMEMVRTMLWNKLMVAVSLVAVGGLFAAASAEEPVPNPPSKAKAEPPVAVAPKSTPSPKDLVLAAWDDAQKCLKSGIGEGVYEASGGWHKTPDGKPVRYAVKVYHDGPKFHIEMTSLSNELPYECPTGQVVIYDGEALAYREIGSRHMLNGEMTWLRHCKEGDLHTVGAHIFPFNPTKLPSHVMHLPGMLRNRPNTEFVSGSNGVSASSLYPGKPPGQLTIQFPKEFGCRIGSMSFQVDMECRQSASAKWARSGEVWYVQEIETELKNQYRQRMTYTSFQANAKVDPALFRLPALGLSAGSNLVYYDPATEDCSIYKCVPKPGVGRAGDTLVDGLRQLRRLPPLNLDEWGRAQEKVTAPKK